ncbi:Protein kinase C signaling pathway involved MAPKK protein [Tilletia horrida]|nr:Protein kinase C signaling pathway involved MAPKK protein [Tilletia horrida]
MESVIPPKPAKRLGMPKLSIPPRPSSSSGIQPQQAHGFGDEAGQIPPVPTPPSQFGRPQPPESGHSSSGSIHSIGTGSNASSPSHDWHPGGSGMLHIPSQQGQQPAQGGYSSTYSTNATVRASQLTTGAAGGLGAHGYGGGYGGEHQQRYTSSMYPDTVPRVGGDYADPAAMTNDLRRAISGLSLSNSLGSRGSNDFGEEEHGGPLPDSSRRSDLSGAEDSRLSASSSLNNTSLGAASPPMPSPLPHMTSNSSSNSHLAEIQRSTSSQGGVPRRPSNPRSHSSGGIQGDPAASGSNSHGSSTAGAPEASDVEDDIVLEGNLEILCRLGEGSSGEVQKALHRPTGLLMAKKSISTSPNPDIHRQILRELSFLRTCHSPYIVKYYGAFLEEEDTQIAICMEFCEGGSLDAIYKRVMARNGRTGEKVLAKVAECVLMGLEYLHERNIIHRDIKPSNIVLTRKGEIKLCDLGVAGELVDSVAGTFTGTSYYMAPERIQGLPNYKINSDVWSLGLTLLEVASNRFPFPPEGEPPLGPFDLITYVIAMEIPQLKDDESGTGGGVKWTKSMRDFISRTLEKDAAKRYGPGRMLQHPWIKKSRERVPQPDIGKFVSEVWGWSDADANGGDAAPALGTRQGNATPVSPLPPSASSSSSIS